MEFFKRFLEHFRQVSQAKDYQRRIEGTQREVDKVLAKYRTTFISRVKDRVTLLEVVPLEEIEKAKQIAKDFDLKPDAPDDPVQLSTSPVAPESSPEPSKV